MTTTYGVRYRQSAHCNAFDIGLTYTREFSFYTGPSESAYATDISLYDAVKLVVYDSANVKVDIFTATILDDDEYLEDDASGTPVANRCRFTILPTGSPGNYFFHVIGITAGVPHQLATPAKVGYYEGPPTS